MVLSFWFNRSFSSRSSCSWVMSVYFSSNSLLLSYISLSAADMIASICSAFTSLVFNESRSLRWSRIRGCSSESVVRIFNTLRNWSEAPFSNSVRNWVYSDGDYSSSLRREGVGLIGRWRDIECRLPLMYEEFYFVINYLCRKSAIKPISLLFLKRLTPFTPVSSVKAMLRP